MAARRPRPLGLCRPLSAAREEPQDNRPRQPEQQPADRRDEDARPGGRIDGSLARQWDATLAYAYTDAEISRSNAGDQGQPVAGVPKHTASAWLSHRFSTGGRGQWTVGGGLRYTGSQWTGTSAITTPASTIADALLAYDAGDWRLAFNVTNLTDKVQITQCLARGDCFYGQRRTYLLTSTYRF